MTKFHTPRKRKYAKHLIYTPSCDKIRAEISERERTNMTNEIYEYTVRKKSEGNYKLARLGMVLFYVLFAGAFFAVCYVTRLIPVFAMCPVLLWILSLLTWRYVDIEYKYTVDAGMLRLYAVYGGKKAKEKAAFHIKDAAAFIPLHEALDEIQIFKAEKTYNFLSSVKSAKDPYGFMIVQNGVRTIALIEVPATSEKAIMYYATDSVRAGELNF